MNCKCGHEAWQHRCMAEGCHDKCEPGEGKVRKTKVTEAIRDAAFSYCDDVKRATGDVVLSPELLGEIMARIARIAATEAVLLSNSEYEIYRDGVPGRLVEIVVAAVMGDES